MCAVFSLSFLFANLYFFFFYYVVTTTSAERYFDGAGVVTPLGDRLTCWNWLDLEVLLGFEATRSVSIPNNVIVRSPLNASIMFTFKKYWLLSSKIRFRRNRPLMAHYPCVDRRPYWHWDTVLTEGLQRHISGEISLVGRLTPISSRYPLLLPMILWIPHLRVITSGNVRFHTMKMTYLSRVAGLSSPKKWHIVHYHNI